MPDPEGIRADATEEPQPVQFLHDRLAGLLATHALEGATGDVDRPVRVHDVDGVEAESAPYLEVVGVMRRGDLEDTCTEFGIYVLVGEDLYLPLDKRNHHPASDKITVPRISGVDDERHVAKHGFRTRREDLGVIFSVRTRAFAVRYPFADGKGPGPDGEDYAQVFSTRPETMLGDVALVVNPGDARYSDLIGRRVVVPFVEREIEVFADEHVDPEFGTGVLKVTPAHDPNDFEIGGRLGLDPVNVMNPDGTINVAGGPFEGMSREEAREAVVKELDGLGLLGGVRPYAFR